MSIHSHSLHGWRKSSLCVRFPSCLLVAALCSAALPSRAATTSTWIGGASGTWGSAYQDNWSGGYPNSTAYAKFDEPKSSPITVQVDESVDAYGVVGAAGRTAGLIFTGSGTLNNYRGDLYNLNGSSCLTVDWNINIVNKKNPTTTYGTNTFHKSFDCSSIDTFSFSSGSKVTFCDSASVTGVRMQVNAGAELEFTGTSSLSQTKDLKVLPGGSLKVADNAVLAPRGLSLPFSQVAGVSDEWTMDGGKILLTSSSGFNAASTSLNFPYTNATKTVSGTGAIQMYILSCSSASNSTLCLNGPDMYLRSVAGDYHKNNYLHVTGGSTIGAWGADVNLSTHYVKFTGSAAIDTTDGADGTTPRTITLTRLGASSGRMMARFAEIGFRIRSTFLSGASAGILRKSRSLSA